jgi:hypothetical protein
MARKFAMIVSLAFIVVCTLIQFASAKPAGLRVIYDVTVNSDGETVKMESKYFIQDKAVRFETSGPSMGPMGKMIMIAKPEAKKYILLMEAKKSYMEMPEPSQKEPAATASKEAPFKATGKSKTIAGYSCDVYERTLEGRNEEACASKDLNDAFAELERSMPKGKGDKSALPGGMNGFPLEYIVKTGTTVQHEMRVRELKRETLAANLFDVPKGYQKQAMPTFGGMPPMPKMPAGKPRR